MRVLFLSHRVPYPPDKGDKIRSFRLLEALSKHHEVRLVTHADDPRDLQHLPELRKRCRTVSVYPASAARRMVRSAMALASGRAVSLHRFYDGRAAREVRGILENEPPDVIVIFSAQPAAYLPDQLAIPVVVDLVDVDSEKWAGYARQKRGLKRWIYAREARIVRTFERGLAARGFGISVATAREAELFHAAVAPSSVKVVSNGVEVEGVVQSGASRIPGLLVFAGAMDYEANEDAASYAARSVLPLVRNQVPHATLRIVGRNPGRSVRALGRLPGVHVTGEVKSVAAELDRAEVSLVPLRIVRGVPNKVLEAFARAVPVVTTPAVLSAIGATDAEHALASDGPEGLAGAVVRLLSDRALAERIGTAGRAFAAERFRWERFETEMLDLVDQVAGKGEPAWRA